MEVDVIIYAMKLAVEANVRNIKYIKATLNNWSKANVKTLLQAQEENQLFKSKTISKEETKQKKSRKSETFEQRDYSNFDFNKILANRNIVEGETKNGC